MTGDQERRLAVLRAAAAGGEFESVVFGHHFWFDDPFDVPQVHASARQAFADMMETAGTPTGRRLMMVLGEVGAGKTHLLRTLRSHASSGREALCAYAQFSASRPEFEQHFLAELIASMDKPVYGRANTPTAFATAYEAVWKAAPDVCSELDQRWTVESTDDDESADDDEKKEKLKASRIARVVRRAAARVMSAYKLPDEDLSTVKALILANAPDSGPRTRAKQFLRGEPLTDLDRELVPDLPALTGPPNYAGQLISCTRVFGRLAGPFVYFFDQMESLDTDVESIKRAVEAIRLLLEAVSELIVVVAWERVRYESVVDRLPNYLGDRLKNGVVQTLNGQRTENEIRLLLEKRFAVILGRDNGPGADEVNPLDPLPADFPKRLGPIRTRAALYKARCAITGENEEPASAPDTGVDDRAEEMDTRWEAALSAAGQDGGLTDRAIVQAIAWAVSQASIGTIRSPGTQGTLVWHDVDLTTSDGASLLRLFALTRDPRGGGLLTQVQLASRSCEGRIPVGLRRGPYPTRATTKTAPYIEALFSAGGDRFEVADEELRTIFTYRAFTEARGDDRGFAEWSSRARVLENLEIVRKIRTLAGAVPAGPGSMPPSPRGPLPGQNRPSPSPAQRQATSTAPAASPPVGNGRDVLIGMSPEKKAVTLPLRILTRHTVALGGSGSGKTTLILRIVEQALMHGVPAVLVDRKGDFAAYADPEVWSAASAESVELRKRIAVSLYTPGKTAGRHLALRLLPDDFDNLHEEDRDEASRAAADGLAQMIGLKESPLDRQRREVLKQAIDRVGSLSGTVTGDLPGRGVDLRALIHVLDRDQGLVAALAHLDSNGKHRKALVPMLEQLRLSRGVLFGDDGDPLDFPSLLAPVGGKARLAIVSLGFLPEIGDQQFFVSRLLAEARRFCRMRPAVDLQALLVLDEADVYMPATSKPVTKDPLLDLLRRARSGGMGLILGTQSPGDLDYNGRENITTWALGRIQGGTALNKVSFVGEGSPIDIRALLPQFSAGRFLLRSETTGLCEVQAERSLIETRQMPEEKLVVLSKNSE